MVCSQLIGILQKKPVPWPPSLHSILQIFVLAFEIRKSNASRGIYLGAFDSSFSFT
jgi:hypothetical protein